MMLDSVQWLAIKESVEATTEILGNTEDFSAEVEVDPEAFVYELLNRGYEIKPVQK